MGEVNVGGMCNPSQVILDLSIINYITVILCKDTLVLTSELLPASPVCSVIEIGLVLCSLMAISPDLEKQSTNQSFVGAFKNGNIIFIQSKQDT